LQLGKAIFPSLHPQFGGYLTADEGGYQVLYNWRGKPGSFHHVSVSDVLNDRIPSNLFRGRVVLMGAYAPSLNDKHSTSFGQMYGVEILTNFASQIISAAVDGRPLISSWSEKMDYIWLLFWIILTVSLVWSIRTTERVLQFLFLVIGVALGLTLLLSLITYTAFLMSFWIPSAPALVGIWSSSFMAVVAVYIDKWRSEKQKYILQLETEVQQRTQDLKIAQEQLLSQERLAFLGRLNAGLSHENKNIFYQVKLSSESSQNLLKEISEILEESEGESEQIQEIKEILNYLNSNCQVIQQQVSRAQDLAKKFLPLPSFDNCLAKSSPSFSIELNKLLLECFQIVAKSKPFKEPIKLNQSYDDSLPCLEAVPSEMTFVLVNLIDNAWDAVMQKKDRSPSNYVPTISLATKNLEKTIEIIVADNGEGIPQEKTTEIFQFFVSTKPPSQGTGLGLSLASDIIVARYHGQIRLEQQDGLTQFIITLPKSRLNLV
jgi:signal transduction histidine kinase